MHFTAIVGKALVRHSHWSKSNIGLSSWMVRTITEAITAWSSKYSFVACLRWIIIFIVALKWTIVRTFSIGSAMSMGLEHVCLISIIMIITNQLQRHFATQKTYQRADEYKRKRAESDLCHTSLQDVKSRTVDSKGIWYEAVRLRWGAERRMAFY